MNILSKLATSSPCYKTGRKLATVKGLTLHSVGCAQPSAQVWYNIYNQASYSRAGVHAFIDANTGDVWQLLPWNHRGWHAASGKNGSLNDTHIGVEMCESNKIKYTGGATFTVLDWDIARKHCETAYNAAVELFAYLCKQYNLDPLKDGVILSHNEGNKRGLASAHADPEHYWTQLKMPYTMDGFRKDVSATMKGTYVNTTAQLVSEEPEPVNQNTQTTTSYTVTINTKELNVRSGPGVKYDKVMAVHQGETYTIVKEQVTDGTKWGYLKSGKGWISLAYTTIKSVAQVLETAPISGTYKVKVTASSLNIRSGPGTSYSKVGAITDKGTYTIINTKDGWGQLKSKTGWIYLSYTKKV